MSATAETIRELVAPVVMISANGLICLALYNRLAAVVTRLRSFHKEQYEALSAIATAGRSSKADISSLRLRADCLAEQTRAIAKRALLLRNALIAMLLGVVSMQLCSLALGLANLFVGLASIGLGLFVSGVAFMLIGTGIAIAELATSLETVSLENLSVEEMSTSTRNRHRHAA